MSSARVLTFICFAFLFVTSPARAEPDPNAAVIEAFHAALLDTMKQGPKLGAHGRFKKLEPAVDAAFDLAVMTKFSVGPNWSKYSAAEQKLLIAAFRRMTVATYAHNFKEFKGQKFSVDAKVDVRGPDRLVKSQVLPEGEKPVNLTYRMRDQAGKAKVIDVIYEYVSQLATKRSDFATTLADGGAKALVEKLDKISDDLLSEAKD